METLRDLQNQIANEKSKFLAEKERIQSEIETLQVQNKELTDALSTDDGGGLRRADQEQIKLAALVMLNCGNSQMHPSVEGHPNCRENAIALFKEMVLVLEDPKFAAEFDKQLEEASTFIQNNWENTDEVKKKDPEFVIPDGYKTIKNIIADAVGEAVNRKYPFSSSEKQ